MKEIAKFFIRWIVAYVAGAGIAVLIFGLAIRFFGEHGILLILTIIIGLIIWFYWVRTAVGWVNRWLVKW